MNNRRLRYQRVYLAGAMDRVSDRGTTWRDELTPFLEKMGLYVFNPLNKPIDIGAEDEETHKYKKLLKQEKKYDELSSIMKTIRSVDLRLVDISDFLIVNLDIDTHPCGTYEEIFWANRQKKPIIIHMVQGKQSAPDWIFGTVPHEMIFSNWNEVREYIIHINEAKTIKSYGRWHLINHG
jgi:nucleoside 2-deoxyribosyltransferase